MPQVGGQVPASQASDKGVISQLQEFIQGSKDWKGPAGRSVLQWAYDERKDKAGASEFRATVTFVLDGVPHHVVGEWKSAKHLAKRDLAERALRLYVTTWGEQLLQERHLQSAIQLLGDGGATQAGRSAVGKGQSLEHFLQTLPGYGDAVPRWSFSWTRGENQNLCCQAIVEVVLHGVAHKFMGAKCENQDEAKEDTAERTLWYLQCPGFEDKYEPDPHSDAARAKIIPAPPCGWTKDMFDESSAKILATNAKANGGPQKIANRKLGHARLAHNANRKDRAV